MTTKNSSIPTFARKDGRPIPGRHYGAYTMEKGRKKAVFRELGAQNTRRLSGIPQTEYLLELQGGRGRKIYEEMSKSDSTIGAMLFGIEMMIRSIRWFAQAAEVAEDSYPSKQQKAAAEWIKTVLFRDMSISWADTLSDIITLLIYGWANGEVVYKQRRGPDQTDSTYRSFYTDGTIGVRKIMILPQRSLHSWEFDTAGGIAGMWQTVPINAQSMVSQTKVFIPISKSLLFKTTHAQGNPEGESALRRAYREWYFIKNIEEFEAIAIEREMNGIPVMRVPGYLLASDDPKDIAIVDKYMEIARDLKFNEQGALLLPSDLWKGDEGQISDKYVVDIQLISGYGQRAIDTDRVIKRHSQNIARTVMADFMMLGGGDKGSFSLSLNKSEMFLTAIQGWANNIAEVINNHLIPTLWLLNSFDFSSMPKIGAEKLTIKNIQEFGAFISSCAKAGIAFTDIKTQNIIRESVGLPFAEEEVEVEESGNSDGSSDNSDQGSQIDEE